MSVAQFTSKIEDGFADMSAPESGTPGVEPPLWSSAAMKPPLPAIWVFMLPSAMTEPLVVARAQTETGTGRRSKILNAPRTETQNGDPKAAVLKSEIAPSDQRRSWSTAWFAWLASDRADCESDWRV